MPVADSDMRANRLLEVLPAGARDDVAGRATVRDYATKDVVYEQGEPIDQVVFPIDGVFSLISVSEDGRGVEIATVGNEGFVGLPLFLQAAQTGAHRALAQVPGRAICLDAGPFLELAGRDHAIQRILLRYTQALISQIAQGSACNRLHSVEQRCTRWLLQTHDRVGADEFLLTQEFLGQMLGVGRPTVNAAGQALQDRGLIRYSRGRITILDRAGLEAAVCECYGVIRGEFERLFEGEAK